MRSFDDSEMDIGMDDKRQLQHHPHHFLPLPLLPSVREEKDEEEQTPLNSTPNNSFSVLENHSFLDKQHQHQQQQKYERGGSTNSSAAAPPFSSSSPSTSSITQNPLFPLAFQIYLLRDKALSAVNVVGVGGGGRDGGTHTDPGYKATATTTSTTITHHRPNWTAVVGRELDQVMVLVNAILQPPPTTTPSLAASGSNSSDHHQNQHFSNLCDYFHHNKDSYFLMHVKMTSTLPFILNSSQPPPPPHSLHFY